MSLKDLVRVERTGFQYNPPMDLSVTVSDGQPIEYSPIAYAEEYFVTMTLRARFVANDAMYESVFKNARRMLASELYRDVLHELYQINDVINYDRVQAQCLVVKLIDNLRQDVFEV